MSRDEDGGGLTSLSQHPRKKIKTRVIYVWISVLNFHQGILILDYETGNENEKKLWN